MATTAVAPVPPRDGGDEARRRRARSVRLALTLASIAIVFFVGVLFSRTQQSFSALMSFAGIALMVILAVLLVWGSRK